MANHALEHKRVALIGFGSQGRAQALNLRDSGVNVIVGLRADSASRADAQATGLAVADVPAAVAAADVVVSLIPDDQQRNVIAESIAGHLKPGAYLGFGHGYAVRFGDISVPAGVGVFLAAPRGPGRLIRRQYEQRQGFVCSIATGQDPAGDTLQIARAYALAIGAAPTAIFETTFQQECEADLFGEQAVLCGGLVELIRAAYETLAAAGFDEQMAYFECVHEVKLIVDLIHERGIAGMRAGISTAARFGGLTRGPRVIGEEARAAMRKILAEIQSGQFAKELEADAKAGGPLAARLQAAEAAHPLEAVGRRLRKAMPWLEAGDEQED